MAQEKLISPPLRKPVQEYLTPDPSVGFFTELIDRTDPAYRTPFRGMPYSSIRDAKQWVVAAFPNLVFLKEARWRESDQFVTWTFGTDPHAEDTYNSEVTYSGESASCPIYTRVYTVRREAYDADPSDTVGTPLKTIISVNVTNHGSGYTSAIVTSSNGASITPVISNGKIASLVLTSQGSDVTSAPAITITGDGAGAAATASIQSQSAVLVSQKKVEFSQDHPLRNEYVQVVMVYETLPGPAITGEVVTGEGQIGTLTRQTVTHGTTVTPSALMVSGSVQPQSAVKSVLETLTVTSVFPDTRKSAERPDLTPAKFKALIPTLTGSSVSAGEIDSTITLGTGEISESQEQITEFKKRVSTTARAATTLPSTITQKKTTPEGLVATVSEILSVDGEPSSTASALVSFQTDKLGDGRMVETVETLPSVFPDTHVSAQKPDVVPEKFRASVQTHTTAEVTAATSVSMPTLGTGELEKSEQLITAFKKRTSTTSRDNGTLPTLSGQEYDSSLGIGIPFTESILTEYSGGGQDVNPLSDSLWLARDITIAEAQSALEDVYVTFPAPTTIDLPSVLKSVECIWSGTSSESSTHLTDYESVIAKYMPESEIQTNASITGAFNVVIKEGFRGSVPSIIHTFFLPLSSATTGAIAAKIAGNLGVTVLPWPVCIEQSDTIVLTGEERRIGYSKKVAGSTGTGPAVWFITNNKVGSTHPVILHLPATIHPAITVTETGSNTATGTATWLVDDPMTLTATGSLSKTEISATNVTAFTPGVYIKTAEVRLYKYGCVMVTATTVEITSEMV